MEAAEREAPESAPREAGDHEPHRMYIDPEEANPGDVIAIHFPDGEVRGLGFVLERRGEGWEAAYVLHAGEGDTGPFQWWPANPAPDGAGWDDIGVDGLGPDFVQVPPEMPAGDYRICTANSSDRRCAGLRVLD
jgi:hypothetical protein